MDALSRPYLGAPGPVLWRGEPMRRKVLRRHLGRAVEALVYQAGSIASLGLTVRLAVGQGFPLYVMLPFVLGALGSLVAGLIATRRAIAAARHRRYAITRDMLVTESPDQRDERQLSSLPELVFDGEGDGVATISGVAETPAIWRWLKPFVPVRLETEVLLESVPDAQRAMALLRTSSGAATHTEVAPDPPGVEPQPPVEVARRARPLLDWVGTAPLTLGLTLTAVCVLFLVLILQRPWQAGSVVALVFVLATLGLGIASIYAHVSRWRLRAALRRNGVRVMAEVRGLARANVRVNDVEMWEVQYAYQAEGDTFVADSGVLPFEEAERWSPGDRVLVAYDRANPSISIWLGGNRAGND